MDLSSKYVQRLHSLLANMHLFASRVGCPATALFLFRAFTFAMRKSFPGIPSPPDLLCDIKSSPGQLKTLTIESNQLPWDVQGPYPSLQ